MFNRSILSVILFSVLPACSSPRTIQDSLNEVQTSPDFKEIIPSFQFAIDQRYATENNFVGKNMYGIFNRVYLHKNAFDKIHLAAKKLQALKPGYKILIFDALRPRSVQYVLWDKVKGTENEQYVADPALGSIHNYGLAIDLTVVDEKGKELDMGTPYDTFDRMAQPKLEEELLKNGKLTKKQIQNRKLLRKVMEESGFIQLPHEWWHYDLYPRTEVKANFKIVE